MEYVHSTSRHPPGGSSHATNIHSRSGSFVLPSGPCSPVSHPSSPVPQCPACRECHGVFAYTTLPQRSDAHSPLERSRHALLRQPFLFSKEQREPESSQGPSTDPYRGTSRTGASRNVSCAAHGIRRIHSKAEREERKLVQLFFGACAATVGLVLFSIVFYNDALFVIDGRDVFTQEHHVVTFFYTRLWRRETAVDRQDGAHMQLPSFSLSALLAAAAVTTTQHEARVPLASEGAPPEGSQRTFSLSAVAASRFPSLAFSNLPRPSSSAASLRPGSPSTSPLFLQSAGQTAPVPSFPASAPASTLSADCSSAAGALKPGDLESGRGTRADAGKGAKRPTEGGAGGRWEEGTGHRGEQRRSEQSAARKGADEPTDEAKEAAENPWTRPDTLHRGESPVRERNNAQEAAEPPGRREPGGGDQEPRRETQKEGEEGEEETRPGQEGKTLPVWEDRNHTVEPMRQGGGDRTSASFKDWETPSHHEQRNRKQHEGGKKYAVLPGAADETQENLATRGQGTKDEDTGAEAADGRGETRDTSHGERLETRETRKDKTFEDGDRQSRTTGDEVAGGSTLPHTAGDTGQQPELKSHRFSRISSPPSHTSPSRSDSSSSALASSTTLLPPHWYLLSSSPTVSRSGVPSVEEADTQRPPGGKLRESAHNAELTAVEGSKEERMRLASSLSSLPKAGSRKNEASTAATSVLEGRARFDEKASGIHNATADTTSESQSLSFSAPSLPPSFASSSSTPETRARDEELAPPLNASSSSSHSQPVSKHRHEVQEQNVNILLASYNACKTFTCGDGRFTSFFSLSCFSGFLVSPCFVVGGTAYVTVSAYLCYLFCGGCAVFGLIFLFGMYRSPVEEEVEVDKNGSTLALALASFTPALTRPGSSLRHCCGGEKLVRKMSSASSPAAPRNERNLEEKKQERTRATNESDQMRKHSSGASRHPPSSGLPSFPRQGDEALTIGPELQSVLRSQTSNDWRRPDSLSVERQHLPPFLRSSWSRLFSFFSFSREHTPLRGCLPSFSSSRSQNAVHSQYVHLPAHRSAVLYLSPACGGQRGGRDLTGGANRGYEREDPSPPRSSSAQRGGGGAHRGGEARGAQEGGDRGTQRPQGVRWLAWTLRLATVGLLNACNLASMIVFEYLMLRTVIQNSGTNEAYTNGLNDLLPAETWRQNFLDFR
ncbi:putative transmembrane protein [Toxoplasma gondii RUB]|uniref:Putative transmembrane protein n=1 Tax=Toxoplasma gondii RUB TaxID=935652 RepID=A0A086LLK5_TOXGO|nr:putative transmembrane protein [Toxoplasma gondii RUB]